MTTVVKLNEKEQKSDTNHPNFCVEIVCILNDFFHNLVCYSFVPEKSRKIDAFNKWCLKSAGQLIFHQ